MFNDSAMHEGAGCFSHCAQHIHSFDGYYLLKCRNNVIICEQRTIEDVLIFSLVGKER